MNARLLDCTPEEYHADPCDVPSLSSSIAHILLTKSPLHAWAAHPKLGNVPQKATDEMDQGSLVHAMLLGKGAQAVVLKFDNYRTKEAQTQRDTAREEGLIPLLEREHDELLLIVTRLQKNLLAAGISLEGQAEAVIEWDERGEHGPVRCRRMIDLLDLAGGRTVELKTISSADHETVNRTAERYGWALSYAATIRAVSALSPDLAGRLLFHFGLMEKAPNNEKPRFKEPFVVRRAVVDGAFEELGMRRWERAVRLWEKCLLTDSWPGYEERPISPPPWAMAMEEAEL